MLFIVVKLVHGRSKMVCRSYLEASTYQLEQYRLAMAHEQGSERETTNSPADNCLVSMATRAQQRINGLTRCQHRISHDHGLKHNRSEDQHSLATRGFGISLVRNLKVQV
jgi:hypothetical protein